MADLSVLERRACRSVAWRGDRHRVANILGNPFDCEPLRLNQRPAEIQEDHWINATHVVRHLVELLEAVRRVLPLRCRKSRVDLLVEQLGRMRQAVSAPEEFWPAMRVAASRMVVQRALPACAPPMSGRSTLYNLVKVALAVLYMWSNGHFKAAEDAVERFGTFQMPFERDLVRARRSALFKESSGFKLRPPGTEDNPIVLE